MAEMDQYVVKNGAAGSFYELSDETYFLLKQLDGRHTSAEIRAAFEKRFGKPLSTAEVDEFVQLARDMGFLKAGQGLAATPATTPDLAPPPEAAPARPEPAAPPAPTPPSSQPWLSLLHLRLRLIDPDRVFTWLAPKLGFFWTPVFVLVSALCILMAVVMLWTNRLALVDSAVGSLTWETAVYAWLVLLVVTVLHECAHGLTCKHFGGDVHDMGFLLIFLMPGFYCNVSDAWLFKRKSHRLWVTLAGGYFELFLWALAVFIWRLTLPGTLVHHLAYVVLAVCGVQVLFNFNPLLKLDGYYLLSDWLILPNLRQRALTYLMGHVRWLLWGAARPEEEKRGRFLLLYGVVSWTYSLAFLVLMLVGLTHFTAGRWGWLGLGGTLVLAVLSVRGIFQGFSAGEASTMLLTRPHRTAVWALTAMTVAGVLIFGEMADRAGGSFQVRPATHVELRAPVAGFLRTLYAEEGDRVTAGMVVAQMEVPDLASRIAQKQAEVRETQARLRLLEAGPRPEAVAEQRSRVERAGAWRDLAGQDLRRAQQTLQEDLTRLDDQIDQHRAELEFARSVLARARRLLGQRASSEEQVRDAEKHVRVAHAQMDQGEAQKRSRQVQGTREAETELARRDKDLADARGSLTLLEAGTRPEEIEAERARLARLQEDLHHLEHLQSQGAVVCPVAGVIITPRLKEKKGQYLKEGDLIGLVEEPAALEAEIVLAEQDVANVQPGQMVALKPRALPYAVVSARVDRIAPAATRPEAVSTGTAAATVAARGEVQSNVIIYCRLDGVTSELRPGMTGYARVYTGQRSVGGILGDRALRYLRTEFWW
jgi:multidrug efflux pump subunit AcrA (membrane-fusion protein)